MKRDRRVICEIISDMIENPDKCGIFPTSTTYTKLELYIEMVRVEAIGWAHADACVKLDNEEDPRVSNVPEMLQRAKRDLDGEE